MKIRRARRAQSPQFKIWKWSLEWGWILAALMVVRIFLERSVIGLDEKLFSNDGVKISFFSFDFELGFGSGNEGGNGS